MYILDWISKWMNWKCLSFVACHLSDIPDDTVWHSCQSCAISLHDTTPSNIWYHDTIAQGQSGWPWCHCPHLVIWIACIHLWSDSVSMLRLRCLVSGNVGTCLTSSGVMCHCCHHQCYQCLVTSAEVPCQCLRLVWASPPIYIFVHTYDIQNYFYYLYWLAENL